MNRVRIYFRPNDVYVTSREESLQVKGKITKTHFQGPIIELIIEVGAEKPILGPPAQWLVDCLGLQGRRPRGLRRRHRFPFVRVDASLTTILR